MTSNNTCNTFYSGWRKALHKTEKELVNLLLVKSSKVVRKTERDLEEQIRIQCPSGYEQKESKIEEKKGEEKHLCHKTKLGHRRIHK